VTRSAQQRKAGLPAASARAHFKGVKVGKIVGGRERRVLARYFSRKSEVVQMPQLPPRICRCGHVVPPGARCNCQLLAAIDWENRRGSASYRGYDDEWRRLRARFLRQHLYCEHADCNRRAEEVHHKLSVREHPELRLIWSNLMALCRHHHSQVTARTQGFARTRPAK
jgi:5-methylcytosine-specific restriction endonuclease McrA